MMMSAVSLKKINSKEILTVKIRISRNTGEEDKMVREELLQKAIAHNEVCDRLRAEGYSIQGCGNDFNKCNFASGEYPNQKIAGYIDAKTLNVVWLN